MAQEARVDMPSFSQMDILINLVSFGQLDCEVIGGDTDYPKWDGGPFAVSYENLTMVVSYNDGHRLEINDAGHVKHVDTHG